MQPARLIPGLFGLAGVALGATAAHGIADPLAASALERASLYLLIHAAALLALGPGFGLLPRLGRLGIALGAAMFSGALMLKYLAGWTVAGGAAPAGGMILMLGWALIAISAFGKGR